MMSINQSFLEQSNQLQLKSEQYRIYKRGDQIQGIFNPPLIVNPVSNTNHVPIPIGTTTSNGGQEGGPKHGFGSSSSSKSKNNPKMATTCLLELAKFHGLTTEYHLIRQDGPPHCPIFTIQLHLGPTERYEGTGLSIKKAQLAAAEVALAQTSLTRPAPRNTAPGQSTSNYNFRKPRIKNPQRPPRIYKPSSSEDGNNPLNDQIPIITTQQSQEHKNPISILHEICMRMSGKIEYSVVAERGPAHQKVFTVRCKVMDTTNEKFVEAEGPTKQLAKKIASELMLAQLAPQPTPVNHANKPIRKKPHSEVIRETKDSESPISKLMQLAHTKKFSEPVFEVVEDTTAKGPTTETEIQRRDGRFQKYRVKPSFTMRATVGTFSAEASGPSKKASKKAAAESLLTHMGCNYNKEPNQPKPIKPMDTEVKFTSGKQLAPGVLVLTKDAVVEDKKPNVSNSNLVNEPIPNLQPSMDETEHTDKLGYLAKLLGVHLSFSDFPKKSDFLSVVSMSTTPPHVAHGVGPTSHQARNLASLKILEELSDTGIDPLQFN